MAVDSTTDSSAPVTASEALAAARARRLDLHEVIVGLEAATAAPASGRTRDWSARVHDALVEVGGAFERHIAVVEGPDGLFDEVTEAAPRLANALEGLRREHLEIRGRIVTALDAVRHIAGSNDHPVDDGREAVLGVLQELMRHRQHGADVVYEAYAVDIGTGD
jgi:hypothetical protein